MQNFRNRRVSEDIKREISSLIYDGIKDPRVTGGLVSIVRTELSGDGSHCKVYVSHLDGIDAAKNAVKGLISAEWIIKKRISDKLHLRKCPELKFIADDSIAYSADLNKMLEGMNKSSDTDE